jgi:hypothetical protein
MSVGRLCLGRDTALSCQFFSDPKTTLSFYLFIYFWLGFELRALSSQSKRSTASATPPAHFALTILEMESLALLAQPGLEPASQVPRITGVSHRCPAILLFFKSPTSLLGMIVLPASYSRG